MGEVYRARDTQLGRDVAIKILSRALRDDREHVARFEREARVLAALNHPHIGVVYGLQDVDGLDGEDKTTTLVDTPVEERNGELSPDGRWLAYEGESTSIRGQLDIYVRPFPAVNRAVWQVTRDGGTFPVWSRDGRTLFYRRARRHHRRCARGRLGHDVEGGKSDGAVSRRLLPARRQSGTGI
jgi:WD40-like Beta Propeller Repeat